MSREGCAVLLTGDVMTGRGIDQALPRPADPALAEPFVRSALAYVEMAQRQSGPIPIPVDPAYVWGDALEELRDPRADARIVNLETAVTRRGEPMPGKGIHYRMSPENAEVLSAAAIDACVLANNHVLDWGPDGLGDTLATLDRLGIARAGAGLDQREAEAPAVLPMANGGRVLLLARCLPTSGVPQEWAAGADRPGVAYISRLGRQEADAVAEVVAAHRREGDRVILSIHWGPNWGYEVTRRERSFARALTDAGVVDAVHGHSSHHPRPPELRGGRPILYGCGDFLNDYEGIGGHEAYRPELVLLHRFEWPGDGARGASATLVPFRVRRFRLERASREEARWLAGTLEREGKRLGTRLTVRPDGALELRGEG